MLSMRPGTAAKILLYLACCLTAHFRLAGQDKVNDSRSWSGVLVSSSCNADEAFNQSPECAKKVPGAKLALYDDTSRVMYSLEPPESVTAQSETR